jgi:hypothetical protein
MSTKLIKRDYDPVTGITEEFWFNDLTDEVTIRKLQDVEHQINANKDMFNQHNRVGYGDSNGAHLAARIPLTVVALWKEQGFDWFKSTDRERRAWLDKDENAVFKVRPGKLNGVTRSRLTTKAS